MRGVIASGLVFLALGCGDIVSAGGGGDGGTGDGGEPDAFVQVFGETRVRVLEADTILPGATVFYHLPDGTQVGQVVTDLLGEATIPDFPDGGGLTLVKTNDTPIRLESVLGVEIGELVVFDTVVITLAPLSSPNGTVNLTMPAQAATSYEVASDCRHGTPPSGLAPGAAASLQITDQCPDANNIAVAVYGLQGGARATFTAVTTSTGSSPALPALQPVVTHRVRAPAATGEVTVRTRPFNAQGRTWDAKDVIAPLTGVEFDLDVGYAGQLIAEMVIDVGLEPLLNSPGVENNESTIFFRQVATAAPGTVIDYDASAPFPTVTTLAVSAGPSLAYTTEGALECGPGGRPDVVRADFFGVAGGSIISAWTVYTPTSDGSITAPRLSAVNQAIAWPNDQFDSVTARFAAAAWADEDYLSLKEPPVYQAFFGFLLSGESEACFLSANTES